MKHLFVPYELAVKAKEKGFNETCLGYFQNKILTYKGVIPESNSGLPNKFKTQEFISAPLYQQLVDWFREKHGMEMTIEKFIHGYFFKLISGNNTYKSSTQDHFTFFEAREAAILKALELITK